MIIISHVAYPEVWPERCTYFPEVTPLQRALVRVTADWALVTSILGPPDLE